MHALGPGALGEIFDDARGLAPGDAERGDGLSGGKPECGGDGAGGGERAQHRGRMEPRAVDRDRRNQREPAHQLRPDHDAAQEILPAAPLPLAGGEHGRDDDGAGMDGAALERVVVILAMGGGAVDERRVEPLRRPGCPIAVQGPAGSSEASTART